MSSTRLLILSAAVLLWSALAGCSRNFSDDPNAQIPSTAQQMEARNPSAATDEEPIETAPQAGESMETPGIVYGIPDGWIPEPPDGSFRVAQYRLPSDVAGAEAAEMVVFYFQGQGGDVDSNIQRWIGMFSMPDGSDPRGAATIDKASANGLPLTTLDISGTYNKSIGPPMAGEKQPFPGYRMLAAVAETEAGPYFFRLTGPASTVQKWENSFEQFLQNIRPGP